MAALGALGLYDGREPREAAAALAVRHHRVGHQVDVIDQHERNAGGLGAGRRGPQDYGKAEGENRG